MGKKKRKLLNISELTDEELEKEVISEFEEEEPKELKTLKVVKGV